MKTKFLTVAVLTLLLVVACQSGSDDVFLEESYGLDKSNSKKKKNQSTELELSHENLQFTSVEEMLVGINSNLAQSGASYRIEKLEYLTNNDGENMGQIIYANNRSLR